MRDSRFVVRRASRVGFSVIASPKLIARVGEPADLAGLALLPTTGFIDRNTGRRWPWQFSNGQHFTPTNLTVQTDDADCECRAVAAGLGFGQIVSLSRPLLRAGKVVSVLTTLLRSPGPYTCIGLSGDLCLRAYASCSTRWSRRWRSRSCRMTLMCGVDIS